MDYENIGIKVENWGLNRKSGKLTLRIWLFWKDKTYPLNFIGRGIFGVARRLDITEEEASSILIMKLENFVKTVEDEKMKVAVETRLKRLRHDPPSWKTQRTCCGCNQPFIPKHTWQRYCNGKCREETRLRRQRVHDVKLEHVKKECFRRPTISELNNPRCPRCGGLSIKKGTRMRSDGVLQMYQCTDCERTFPETYVGKPK